MPGWEISVFGLTGGKSTKECGKGVGIIPDTLYDNGDVPCKNGEETEQLRMKWECTVVSRKISVESD